MPLSPTPSPTLLLFSLACVLLFPSCCVCGVCVLSPSSSLRLLPSSLCFCLLPIKTNGVPLLSGVHRPPVSSPSLSLSLSAPPLPTKRACWSYAHQTCKTYIETTMHASALAPTQEAQIYKHKKTYLMHQRKPKTCSVGWMHLPPHTQCVHPLPYRISLFSPRLSLSVPLPPFFVEPPLEYKCPPDIDMKTHTGGLPSPPKGWGA